MSEGQPATKRRVSQYRLGALFVTLATLIIVTLSVAPAETDAASVAPATTNVTAANAVSSSQYTLPHALPFRTETEVMCIISNCTNSHNFWAIDFVGEFGQWIYPTGNGLVDSVKIMSTHAGNEYRIIVDHGAGITSTYAHLWDVRVAAGDHVTIDSKLGRMGPPELDQPGDSPYLHYEVDRLNSSGKPSPIYPGDMAACLNGQAVDFPSHLGHANWATVPRDELVDSTGSQCFTEAPHVGKVNAVKWTADPPSRLKVSWSAPSSNQDLVTGYTVSYRKYKHQTKEWSSVRRVKRVGPAATSAKLSGLKLGHKYRVHVDAQDARGSSRNTTTQVLVGRPNKPRVYTYVRGSRVTVSWSKTNGNGDAVRKYKVGKKKGKSSIKWRGTKQREHSFTLKRGKYRFLVKAKNKVGWGEAGRKRAKIR